MICDRGIGRETIAVVVAKEKGDLGHRPKLSQGTKSELISASLTTGPGHHHRHYREAAERRVDAGEATIDRGLRQRSFHQNRIVTTENQPLDRHREEQASRAIVCPADRLVGLPVDRRPEEEARKGTVRPLDLLLDLPADLYQEEEVPEDHHLGEEERKAIVRPADLLLGLQADHRLGCEAALAVEAEARTDPNRHPKLSLRKKSHQRRIAVIESWESDHRHPLGVEADRRPGSTEGRAA
jgi:hypothetical protein